MVETPATIFNGGQRGNRSLDK